MDKWLWAARIFKTRTAAANACKNGRISRNNVNLKPSSVVKPGDTINVKKPPITYSFRIIACVEQRIGAKLAAQVYENVTDKRQYELLEMSRISGFIDRAHGTGRPTKKERRALDSFTEPVTFGFDDEDGFDAFGFDDEEEYDEDD